MKRIICLIVGLLLICTVAYTEQDIMFRDIPWGTNVPDAIKLCKVGDAYFAESENIPLGYENNYRDPYDVFATTSVPCGHAALTYLTTGHKVAGYDISGIYMFFRYADSGNIKDKNNAQLSAAYYWLSNIVDIKGAYEDLQGKLSGLYGMAEENINEEYEIVRESVWQDSKGAKVILISRESDDKNDPTSNNISLIYLEPNYDEKLKETESIATAYYAKEENDNRSDSVDGL